MYQHSQGTPSQGTPCGYWSFKEQPFQMRDPPTFTPLPVSIGLLASREVSCIAVAASLVLKAGGVTILPAPGSPGSGLSAGIDLMSCEHWPAKGSFSARRFSRAIRKEMTPANHPVTCNKEMHVAAKGSCRVSFCSSWMRVQLLRQQTTGCRTKFQQASGAESHYQPRAQQLHKPGTSLL
jgi:hypothetical protein